jgi:hypothetical protein
MRRISILLALLAFASEASAFGITGTVSKAGGGAVWPCNIDIVNRQTGQPVVVTNDSTLANGTYSLTLPSGRYDLTFKPKVGTHTFQGFMQDVRVNSNVVTASIALPVGKYLTGRVVGTDNVGVPFTDLRFKTSTGITPTNVQDNGTNADGTFTTLVDPNLWIVEVIPANADHKAPVELPNINMTSADVALGNVVVQNGFVLTCSVTDASFFPLANASVIARVSGTQSKMFNPINNTSGTGVATIVLPAGHYDISAIPPPGTLATYATFSQYNVGPVADATLPNFALPPARMMSAHVVAQGTLATVVNADIDVDKMLAPDFPRVETPNDFTDAIGNFSVGVATGTYRLTINPLVATKLLPLRVDNIVVGAVAKNLGTVTCKQGHWLTVNVVAQGTGVPVAGANIDVFNLFTKTEQITIDDVTGATGSTKIVIDTTSYNISISPPSAAYDTAHVIGVFRNAVDTTITVVMPRKGVLGVGDPVASSLRLAAPWPNPSHAGMNFAFAGDGAGELEILDVTGRRVATPWQGALRGEQAVRWDGADDQGHSVPNGIYFARLRLGVHSSVQRVVISH